MSLQLNSVHLAGNVVADPLVKNVGNDRLVGQFTLAINRRWTDRDGKKREEATFVDVEVWGKLADFSGKYLFKGTGIYLEGRLTLDRWQDKEGGKHSRLKVTADFVQFTESKPGSDTAEIINKETGEVTRGAK